MVCIDKEVVLKTVLLTRVLVKAPTLRSSTSLLGHKLVILIVNVLGRLKWCIVPYFMTKLLWVSTWPSYWYSVIVAASEIVGTSR